MNVECTSNAAKSAAMISQASRHILIILVNDARPYSLRANTTMDRLARITGMSERTVRYKIRELEKANLIQKASHAPTEQGQDLVAAWMA